MKYTRARNKKGFTLIEVMVVIVIIAVMAAMIVVSVTLGDPRRELNTQAERLRTILSLAAEEAVIQQIELGAEFNEAGYRFLKWDLPQEEELLESDNDSSLLDDDTQNAQTNANQKIDPETGKPIPPQAEWQLYEGDDILRGYDLPEGMRMMVEVDYEQVDIAAKQTEKSRITTEKKLVPTLYFLSSGEMSPFRIELFLESDARNPIFIEGSVVGQVKVLYEEPR